LKLLFIIDSLGAGGAQRQMVNLAIGLKKNGHIVEFFTYHRGNHFEPVLQQENIPHYLREKPSRYSGNVVRALRHTLRSGQYQLALSFLDTPTLYTYVANFGLRTRVVASERSCDSHQRRVPLKRRALLFCHRFADFITVNSYHQREWLTRFSPALANKSATIYNGVNLQEFSPSERSIRKHPSHELLVVSSVAPFKNGLTLIRALKILRDNYKLRLKVRWAGEHQLSIPERRLYSEEMKRAIEQFNLREQWDWLYERRDVPELMRSHDLLVHPSYLEGVPNAICEALACGVPVVASDVLDHPRLVKDRRNGFLFSALSAEALAAALREFYLLNPSEHQEMRRQARQFAEENLSLEHCVRHYERIFAELCGVHRGDFASDALSDPETSKSGLPHVWN
jgi:GalNAc-alpha-(1->4)-GalNAc-alpha-(1->3)-diNAcBac-PP-undecaprenol alpha-1,4-N-acetyl-D-galactosaminyltransferase